MAGSTGENEHFNDDSLWRSEYLTYAGKINLRMILDYEYLTRLREWAKNASSLKKESSVTILNNS